MDAQANRQESNIAFKQIAAGVKVKVSNIPSWANKVSLTIPGKNIAGWFSIDPDDIGTSGITYEDHGEETVSITFTASGSITERTFIFPVPPTEIPGITLSLYEDDDVIWSRTTPAQPSLSVGDVLKLKDISAASAKRVIKVGVISYLHTDPGADNWKVHYWGGADGEKNADLVATGGTESKQLGASYWSNASQTFYMYKTTVPSDITNYLVWGDWGEGRWFNESNGNLTKRKAYIFNHGGDHVIYE